MNFLGEVKELEIPAAILDGGKGGDQLADSGAVDVIHVGKVYDDLVLPSSSNSRMVLRSNALPSPRVIRPPISTTVTTPASRYVARKSIFSPKLSAGVPRPGRLGCWWRNCYRWEGVWT